MNLFMEREIPYTLSGSLLVSLPLPACDFCCFESAWIGNIRSSQRRAPGPNSGTCASLHTVGIALGTVDSSEMANFLST